MRWFSFFRPGDGLIVVLGLALCGLSFPPAWQGGRAEAAIVRRGGEVFATLDLSRNRRLEVAGPLGTTTIVIENRRARVAADPGRHQHCVRQGWLERPGEIAICAPNEVSVQIAGRTEAYDSLSY